MYSGNGRVVDNLHESLGFKVWGQTVICFNCIFDSSFWGSVAYSVYHASLGIIVFVLNVGEI